MNPQEPSINSSIRQLVRNPNVACNLATLMSPQKLWKSVSSQRRIVREVGQIKLAGLISPQKRTNRNFVSRQEINPCFTRDNLIGFIWNWGLGGQGMHQYFRFEQIEVARNQNSGSRLQLYPPSPLVRIHLNCQLQEIKKEKKKRKEVQHLSKSRNLRRRVFTFRISDIFERDTVALPNFISFTFFWLFSILQNCRTLYNDIHENFGPVCVRQMIYFCRISTPEEIYLTGHFQYVWLLKRFTVSLNLRLNQ